MSDCYKLTFTKNLGNETHAHAQNANCSLLIHVNINIDVLRNTTEILFREVYKKI